MGLFNSKTLQERSEALLSTVKATVIGLNQVAKEAREEIAANKKAIEELEKANISSEILASENEAIASNFEQLLSPVKKEEVADESAE